MILFVVLCVFAVYLPTVAVLILLPFYCQIGLYQYGTDNYRDISPKGKVCVKIA